MDIDLAYLPVTERNEAVEDIRQRPHEIAGKIRRTFPTAVIRETRLKLILRVDEAIVKTEGILSIVVDEKKHIFRRTSYAAFPSKTPSTNFLPDRTRGMIAEPVSRLQFF
jgi:hypothetical protein